MTTIDLECSECESATVGGVCRKCYDEALACGYAAMNAEREHRLRETARADRERTLRLETERERDALIATPDRCHDCRVEYQAVSEKLAKAEEMLRQARTDRDREAFDRQSAQDAWNDMRRQRDAALVRADTAERERDEARSKHAHTLEVMDGLQEELADAISRTYVPLDEMKKRIDAYWDGRRDALRYVAIGSAATCAMQGCSEDSFAATWYRWISWMSVNALVHLGDEDAKRMVGGES